MDGAGAEEGVNSLIQRLQELATGYPDGRIELSIVGGYMNAHRNYSEELFNCIMCKYCACPRRGHTASLEFFLYAFQTDTTE